MSIESTRPRVVEGETVYGFNQDSNNNIPARFQGGFIELVYYGCHNCGNAFWTEGDAKRRLAPGLHHCPHCGVRSEVWL